MAITLITDSLNDCSKEILTQLKCHVVPLSVIFKNDPINYYDGVDINPDIIYERVNNGEDLPKTGAVTVKQFLEVFKNELDKGNQVFYVGSGSGISSTYQNALVAKNELNTENIQLSDSETLSSGIGLLLFKADKYIKEGKSLLEIKELIDQHVKHSSVKFCIDRLDYLYKGGRCNSLSYIFGRILKIHPVIKVENNKLIVYRKIRGNYTKSMDEQISEFKKDLPKIDLEHVFITHSGPKDSDDYKYIYDKLIKYVPKENLHVTRAGSTVSCHCGPKTIGILYLFKL